MAWQIRIAVLPNRVRVRVVRCGRDVRLARFRAVLLAAHRARGYREALESAGLASPESITRLRSIEDILPKLPCLSQAEFRAAPSEFHNPTAPAPKLQRLWRHTPTPVRTAVLAPHFEENALVRVFDPGSAQEIRRFDPEVIAAPLELLIELAEKARRGIPSIPTPGRAIIALTRLEYCALPESARDLLWRTFEVPVFEQLLGADSSVLAWECEAHEGLHTVENNVVVEQNTESQLIVTSLTDRRRPVLRLVTGFTGTLEAEACGCGHPGLRLTGLATPAVESAAAARGA